MEGDKERRAVEALFRTKAPKQLYLWGRVSGLRDKVGQPGVGSVDDFALAIADDVKPPLERVEKGSNLSRLRSAARRRRKQKRKQTEQKRRKRENEIKRRKKSISRYMKQKVKRTQTPQHIGMISENNRLFITSFEPQELRVSLRSRTIGV